MPEPSSAPSFTRNTHIPYALELPNAREEKHKDGRADEITALRHSIDMLIVHKQSQAEEPRLACAILYLRWREGQCLDRCALGRHAVAGVKEGEAGAGGILRDWGEGDFPLLLPLQHRGRRAKAHLRMWRDGDEFPLAALAQVRDGVAIQAVLSHVGQGWHWFAGRLPHRAVAAAAAASRGFLRQVKLGQVTPPIRVLHTREAISNGPGKKAEQLTGANTKVNCKVKKAGVQTALPFARSLATEEIKLSFLCSQHS